MIVFTELKQIPFIILSKSFLKKTKLLLEDTEKLNYVRVNANQLANSKSYNVLAQNIINCI